MGNMWHVLRAGLWPALLICGAVILLIGQGFQPAYSSPVTLDSNWTAAQAEEAVRLVVDYAIHMKEDDPLIKLAPGVWVKRSNAFGVTVDGTVYYYQMSPHASFDPVSRGVIPPDHVRILDVIEAQGIRIVIYILAPPTIWDQSL